MIVRLFDQLDYRFSNQISLGIHCKVITFISEFVKERGRFCKIGDDSIQSSPISSQIGLKHTLGVFESNPDFM